MSQTDTSTACLQSPLMVLGHTRLFSTFAKIAHTTTEETVCSVKLTKPCQPSTQSTMAKSTLDMQTRMKGTAFKIVRRSEPAQNLLTWPPPKVALSPLIPKPTSQVIYNTLYPKPIDASTTL